MSVIDWAAAMDGSRPVMTRDGRKVSIYYTDAPDEYPIYGRIEGAVAPTYWRRDGTYSLHSRRLSGGDLIQQPRRFRYERWVNVYPYGVGGYNYNTREDADQGCVESSRIACIKIIVECEEGEGLE